MTSTLIGASSVQQLEDNVGALRRLDFDTDELAEIDRYATESGLDLGSRARGRAGGLDASPLTDALSTRASP